MVRNFLFVIVTSRWTDKHVSFLKKSSLISHLIQKYVLTKFQRVTLCNYTRIELKLRVAVQYSVRTLHEAKDQRYKPIYRQKLTRHKLMRLNNFLANSQYEEKSQFLQRKKKL